MGENLFSSPLQMVNPGNPEDVQVLFQPNGSELILDNGLQGAAYICGGHWRLAFDDQPIVVLIKTGAGGIISQIDYAR